MKQLRSAVRDYLTMRRGLGFKMARHEVGLEDFISFLERKRSPHITVKLALECDRSLNRSPTIRSSAVSATARSAILLFQSGDQGTVEGG